MGQKRKEIDVAELKRLARLGLKRKQICKLLGISTDTLERRSRESAQFREALFDGKKKALEALMESLYEKALAGDLKSQLLYLRHVGLDMERPIRRPRAPGPALWTREEAIEKIQEIARRLEEKEKRKQERERN